MISLYIVTLKLFRIWNVWILINGLTWSNIAFHVHARKLRMRQVAFMQLFSCACDLESVPFTSALLVPECKTTCFFRNWQIYVPYKRQLCDYKMCQHLWKNNGQRKFRSLMRSDLFENKRRLPPNIEETKNVEFKLHFFTTCSPCRKKGLRVNLKSKYKSFIQ